MARRSQPRAKTTIVVSSARAAAVRIGAVTSVTRAIARSMARGSPAVIASHTAAVAAHTTLSGHSECNHFRPLAARLAMAAGTKPPTSVASANRATNNTASADSRPCPNGNDPTRRASATKRNGIGVTAYGARSVDVTRRISHAVARRASTHRSTPSLDPTPRSLVK